MIRLPRFCQTAGILVIVAGSLAAGAASALVGASVQVERVPLDKAAATKTFETIPGPVEDNAARHATFTVIDGLQQQGSSLDVVHDGQMPVTEDDPPHNFYFAMGTLEGRLRIDLGKPIPTDAIRTYSWHKSNRAPQVYKVYASDGSAADFDPAPKIGIDPTTRGWTKIASVDTRSRPGVRLGGKYAVNLTHISGSLGTYRYVLFEMFVTETQDNWGHTFYSEIQVIEKK